MQCMEKEHIDDAYWSKTIKIGTVDIKPFDLDITRDKVDYLIKKGYDDTKKALDNKIKKEIEECQKKYL
jgi:hypothetical protein